MKAAIVVGALLLALPLAAGADELYLRSGGRISGVVVEQRPDAVVIDVGAGRVTLPAALVLRVVEGTPSFAVFRERAARLGDADVPGWLALAAWARDHDLLTQARQAYEHVLTVDPGNAVAHRELGHVQLDGHWMTADEGYRARGYVYFEGSWMTPEERAGLIAERAASAQARQAEIEAEARIREADARARAAEAEARRAEGYGATEGIPLSMTYGAPYSPYGPYGTYGPVVVYGGYGYGGLGSGWPFGRGSGHRQGPGCGPGHGASATPPAAQAPPPPHRDSAPPTPGRVPASPVKLPGAVRAGLDTRR